MGKRNIQKEMTDTENWTGGRVMIIGAAGTGVMTDIVRALARRREVLIVDTTPRSGYSHALSLSLSLGREERRLTPAPIDWQSIRPTPDPIDWNRPKGADDKLHSTKSGFNQRTIKTRRKKNRNKKTHR